MEQHKVASAIDWIKPVNGVLTGEAHLRASLRAARDRVEGLQTGKSDLGHQPALADATNAGAVGGKSRVEPGDVASSTIAINGLSPAALREPKLAGCATAATKLADDGVISVDGAATWNGFRAGKDFS